MTNQQLIILLQFTFIDIHFKTPYNIIYGYDAQGRLTSEQNKDFIKQHIYNSSGNLERTSYTVNDKALEYSYETDESPSPRSKKIVMPFANQNNFLIINYSIIRWRNTFAIVFIKYIVLFKIFNHDSSFIIFTISSGTNNFTLRFIKYHFLQNILI